MSTGYIFKQVKLESYIFQLFVVTTCYLLLFFIHGKGYLALDSFYHLALAEDIIRGYEGPWLPFTVYENNIPPRHYLFQLLLSPFILFYPFIGSAVFVLLLLYIFLQVYYLLLKEHSVQFSRLWSLLILVSCPLFFIRCIQIRPILLANVLIGLYLLSVKKEKKICILLVSLIFYLSYTAYLILFLYAATHIIIDYTYRSKLSFNVLFFTTLGIILGYILHPCFPNNLTMEIQYYHFKIFNNTNTYFPVIEWFPLNPLSMINHLWIVFFLLLFIIIYYRDSRIRLNKDIAYYSLNSIIWLLLFLNSARYIDYFYPVFLITIAIITSSFQSDSRLNKCVIDNRAFLQILICISMFYTMQQTVVEYNNMLQYSRLEKSSSWLKTNSNQKDIILTSSPDTYAELYTHNRSNMYVHGMDWQYLQAKDEILSNEIGGVLVGNQKIPSKIMKSNEIRYLFIDLRSHFENLLTNCYNDKNLILVYKDLESIIFELKL